MMKSLSGAPVFLLCSLFSLSLFSTETLAFGDEGHEIVAAIAYTRLTPTAKAKVDKLLKADKDKLTAADFVSRATWADKYRDSDRKSTKKHYNATHNWHFSDIDIDAPNLELACHHFPKLAPSMLASEGVSRDCVVDKIQQFSDELKDPSTPQAEKILALKFLMHFVGDLHQPLHAAHHHHDMGGNAVLVEYKKFTTGKINHGNLHSYWDNELVDRLGEDVDKTAQVLLADITPEKSSEWIQSTAIDWAMESNFLAKTAAYNFTGLATYKNVKGEVGNVLTDAYAQAAAAVVKVQIEKAGVRLANILNTSFAKESQKN